MEDVIDVSGYDIFESIGHGNFGNVYAAKDKNTGEEYAVKLIPKRLRFEILEIVKNEANIHAQLDHPNIAKLQLSFETDKYIVMIMEKCSIDLFKIEQTKKAISEQRAIYIFSQICNAVEYMHKLGYVHRDIKAENIVQCKNDVWKLIDFGFSAKHGLFEGEMRGTLDYLAPEIVKEETYKGSPADVWALGVLFYEMLYLSPPFLVSTIQGTHKAIIRKSPDFSSRNIDYKIKNLIEKMLEKDPNKRITIEEVIKLLSKI